VKAVTARAAAARTITQPSTTPRFLSGSRSAT
jgi:hypothetical protein